MILHPVRLPPEPKIEKEEKGEELKYHKEKFIDPSNQFEYGIQSDVEILVLLGKSRDILKEMKEASLKAQDWSGQNYCIGYPGSVTLYVKSVIQTDPSNPEPDVLPSYAYAQACPEFHNIPGEQKNETLKGQVVNALKADCRNYVKCKILNYNSTMMSVNGSAFRGMSGGPLCYVQDSTLHVIGIIVGSAASPVGKFFSYFKRNLAQGKLYSLPPVEQNIENFFLIESPTKLKGVEPLGQIITSLRILMVLLEGIKKTKHDQQILAYYGQFIRMLEIQYKEMVQTFIVNGLKCNHNLVLHNCFRFLQIRKLLCGDSFHYVSVTPEPFFFHRFNFYIQNPAVKQSFKAISKKLADLEQLQQSEDKQFKALNNVFTSFNIPKLETSPQWKTLILKNMTELWLSNDPNFIAIYLDEAMAEASADEVRTSVDLLLKEFEIDKSQLDKFL